MRKSTQILDVVLLWASCKTRVYQKISEAFPQVTYLNQEISFERTYSSKYLVDLDSYFEFLRRFSYAHRNFWGWQGGYEKQTFDRMGLFAIKNLCRTQEWNTNLHSLETIIKARRKWGVLSCLGQRPSFAFQAQESFWCTFEAHLWYSYQLFPQRY